MISFKHIKLLLIFFLIPFKALADNFVGTPQALVDVNNNGAAIYNLSVEIPDGGGFHPQIGLAYNSQSAGYGNAGYGFNITGISVITSGGRNVYYDGQVKGAEYLSNSSFYLDGKRLLLESGTEGTKGAVYTIEGDPYTKVSVDGYWDNSSVSLRFEVVTQDGTKYRYGYNDSSRLSFYKNGKERCSAWYVDEAVDKYNNIIYYRYTKNGLSILPKEIVYGINSHSRGIECKINFAYSDITTANQSEFYIGGYKGKVSKKLSTITSTITNSGNTYTYRKYTLGYNDYIDSSSKKYTRLTSITESNASGETYAPVKIDWKGLEGFSLSNRSISINTKRSDEDEKTKNFFTVDINNDGISDIVRYTEYDGNKCCFDISISDIDSNGKITYTLFQYNIGIFTRNKEGEVTSGVNGFLVGDFNGDGYTDIMTKYIYNTNNQWYQQFTYLKGGISPSTAKASYGKAAYKSYNYKPMSITMDVDGDGKTDIISLSKVKKNGYYDADIIYNSSTSGQCSCTTLSLQLPEDPKRMFAIDLNNDGLSDLIVLGEKSYKVFFNNGFNGSATGLFTNANSKSLDSSKNTYCLRDYQRVNPGDFNGDGLTDFLCSKKDEGKLYLEFNNGDGTFSHKETPDFGLYKQDDCENDDDDFSINVMDFDHDGIDDVMMAKSMFAWHHGAIWEKSYYRYSDGEGTTYMKWLKGTGDNLSLVRTYSKKNREKDASSRYIFVGDFDGDGSAELANYGAPLNSSSTAFSEHTIHLYRMGGNAAALGKVSCITNSLGVRNEFTYSSATDPKVCENGTTHKYPVNSRSIPLSVVSQLSTLPKNINIYTVTKYQYGDMRVHSLGRGMLGFMSFTKKHQNTSVTENITVNTLNSSYYIPTKVTNTTTYADGSKDVKTSVYAIAEIGNAKSGKVNKYFVYPSKNTVTDEYGNVTTTTSTYDFNAERCILKSQKISDDNGTFFKSLSYDYDTKPVGKYGSMWLPKQVIARQKHADDSKTRTKYTTYEYNDWGNPTKVVNNAKTVDSLVTFYTYDSYYGLKKSEKTTGRSVKPIAKNYDHDSSGRFITRQWTSPASSEYEYIEYNYNIYGNLTREQDKKDQNNILLTVHKYNAWNERIETIMPDGKNGVTYTRAWDTSVNQGCYSVTETPVIGPSKKTIYDSLGREIYSSTTGLGGVAISKSISYDGRGYVSSIINKTGKLTITETFTYDGRGRKTSDILSSGASTAYKYGNRNLVTTAKTDSGDRVTTTTYDAWGNVKSIIDPLDTYVEYIYDSNGQPASITTNTNSGSSTTVELTYNAAGYRTKMVDPDAGAMTYKYAADGTILSQTDARGVTTNYSYDDLGRLKTKTYVDKKGNKKTQTNEYFTKGKDVNRLASQTYDGYKRSFTYDNYGHVTSETRYVNHHLSGPTSYTIKWTYDQYGQMTKVSYPGTIAPLVFDYSYDNYGYLKEIKQGSQSVYSLKSYDGLKLETNTVAGVLSKTVDKDGYPYEYQLSVNSTVKDKLNFEYDKSTGNLLTRCWKNNGYTRFNDLFEYDNMDRLVSVSNNVSKAKTMSISYADNGNILNKSDVGQYTYDSEDKPHAVTSVSNSSKTIGSNIVNTVFNLNGKIDCLSSTNGAGMVYCYGPDDEKWMTVSWSPNQTCENDIEHLYFGNYERIIEDDVITEQYFLENGVVLISKTVGSEDPRWDVYQTVTDNLGSVLVVYDEYKKEVFKAKYDAWGKQAVYTNKINFQYGYTGHEMLPDFGLIDMKGRLYDPTLGRFLSCDNYVQAPYDSQNFNRYTYCLNNPLKYTDPSGEIFGIDDAAILIGIGVAAAIGGAVNVAANWDNINNFWDGLGAFGIGAAAGVASGVAVVATVGTGGGAGFLAGLGYGLAAGAIGTAVGTGVTALGNNLAFGTPFPSIGQFVTNVVIGAAVGGIASGISSGLSARSQGLDFWTGKAHALPAPTEPLQGVSVVSQQETALQEKLSPDLMPKVKTETPVNQIKSSPNYHVENNRIDMKRGEWKSLSSHAKGKIGVRLATEDLKAQYGNSINLVEQVHLNVNGKLYIADLSFIDDKGIVHIVEAKAGGGFFTTNQKYAFPKLINGGNVEIVPYGARAGQLFNGNIPSKVTNYQFDILHYTK